MIREHVVNLTEILDTVFQGNVWDDSTQKTAERILKYWADFDGKAGFPSELMTVFAGSRYRSQIVLVQDIEFSSLCAHHLLPFMGKAYVGYIPDRMIIGLSKIPRIVDFYANRPQTQERLTLEVANCLNERLRPQGVAVIIKSKHTCMACRGVRKHNGWMVTSEMLGVFLEEHEPRAELFNMIGLRE